MKFLGKKPKDIKVPFPDVDFMLDKDDDLRSHYFFTNVNGEHCFCLQEESGEGQFGFIASGNKTIFPIIPDNFDETIN